jgi:hypothetical protein
MNKAVVITIMVIVVGCLAFSALIQLIPYGHNHTNPPVIQEPTWDSPQTRALAVRACFDCHSYETRWLWNLNVAPFSWLIQHDVDDGRRRLNFSDWHGQVFGEGGRRREGGGEIAEVIQRGSMPPAIYTLMHRDAILSTDEKRALINGLTSSLK